MKGDFSVLNFDPHEHERGVNPPARGVLRNLSGVLHQQGRVTTDADFTEGELLELGWNGQAGRDVIGAGVCAVPAAEPQGFRVESAMVSGGEVRVMLRPGRAWADGILTRLPGETPDPQAPVERIATYFGPPLASPQPTPGGIGDGTRDAVILEVSEEALHGFQYPERLIEPALGGPDTSERAFVNFRIRLLRLSEGEDCHTIIAKLQDDPSSKGRLTASLAPVVAIAGDCPVVGGGGYTGFEHHLYRVEIADTPSGAPARFKWSQWNGGLVGRGRFDSTTDPDRVIIDAGRAAIVNSGLTSFYLEALQYDELIGAWTVVYGTAATLNTDHDLELAAPASFGTMPSTTASVFFRLWNGIADISAFTNAAAPVELRDGIRLAFDAPAPGTYRPGDYWTFTVRAGEIPNPQILVDDAPPVGIVYHRVPLAEINWTARQNTGIDGTIEDCRRRFRPLTNQKICCTFLIGDGVSSFGDFNSLEEAAAHLPAAGGELCLLPGLHRANLVLDGRRNVTIHGCERRTLVIPRTATKTAPIIRLVDCIGIRIRNLDFASYDGTPVVIEGRQEDACRDVRIHDTRMIARVNAIRATNAAELVIAHNRLHLLDTPQGLATISVAADDTLIERNTLVIIPFMEPPEQPTEPDDDPTRDPADPCAKTDVLYAHPVLLIAYVAKVWAFLLALLVPKQPYRALGGIHVRPGSERVRILENVIVGGAGNGITLGGDLDPAPAPPPPSLAAPAMLAAPDSVAAPSEQPAPVAAVAITVGDDGQFLALVQDEAGKPVAGVDVYLEGATTASDRSDEKGMVSIKAEPGPYALDVAPAYQIVKVSEARNDNALVNIVTIAARAADTGGRGFLHEITIQENDVSMMGLSGIGFATRAGASIVGASRTPTAVANDTKATILAYIDAALLALALTPLMRASDPVRDLVIRGNRLHHNLRNPFTDPMRAEAQEIGRGGISLARTDSAVIAGNHVYENGPRATDPVCGVFIGYGNDVEITDNVVAGNGTVTADYEQNRQAGIRGGIYARFAGSLSGKYSASSGRKPALRVHDNRVDQPAGRALTAFAFGPVSCANNHLNSEHTGRFGFLDAAVGSVLIYNLGGIHRLLARMLGGYLDVTTGANKLAVVVGQGLPGGETLFDDNFVRLGDVNRSLMSQLIIALDDLGYASNQSSVYRGDPLFANAVLFADTVRASASRLREDVSHTISALTFALRMNLTAHNQADHCIVALPPASGSNVLPTVASPNQVLDATFCGRQFRDPVSGVMQFLAQVLAAYANELGGTPTENTFTAAELNTLSHTYTAKSLAAVGEIQTVQVKAYQAESARLAEKLGADHPTVVALKAQAEGGVRAKQAIAASAEAAGIQPPVTGEKTAAVSGRVVNDKGQGQAGYTVELVRADGTRIETVGRTDAAGYYAASYEETKTAALAREDKVFVRIADATGKEVHRSAEPIAVQPGADIRSAVALPLRVVPQSVAATGTVIYGGETRAPTRERASTPLEHVKGIGPKTADKLRAAGIADVETLLRTPGDKLVEIAGFDASVVRAEAEKTLKEGSQPATRTARKTPKNR